MHQNDSDNLAHALHFTVEDLIANRNGYLSDAQIGRLKREIEQNRRWSTYALVFVTIFYVLIFAIIVVTNFDYFKSNPREATGLGIGIGILALGLMLSGILTFRGYNSQRQLRLHSVDGLTKRATFESDGFTYKIIQIHAVRFTAEDEIYQAFRDERQYRIFYVQLFRRYLRIVSAEELPDQGSAR